MTAATLSHAFRHERLQQFVKFCLVGGSGVVVDMGVLFLLADPRCLGLNITLSKILSAEAAMTSNFVWNELWTFRPRPSPAGREEAAEGRPTNGLLRRYLTFNTICTIGIGLAVLLLHLFHTWLGLNLYASNLLAIIIVTSWNFAVNAALTWSRNAVHRIRDEPPCGSRSSSPITPYRLASGDLFNK